MWILAPSICIVTIFFWFQGSVSNGFMLLVSRICFLMLTELLQGNVKYRFLGILLSLEVNIDTLDTSRSHNNDIK